MAETMEQDGSRAPANELSKMSSYQECVCATLKLLADFGKEVGWATWPECLVLLAGAGPLAHANVFSIPALRDALAAARTCRQHIQDIDVVLFKRFLSLTTILGFLSLIATQQTANVQ